MSTEVKVPVLGESITEATVGQWLKQPGDAVALDEPIVSLETDKVAVEVPSPVAGTLAEQIAKEGDTVAVGALIALIGEGGAVAAPAPTNAPAPPSAPAQAGAVAEPDSAPPPASDASLTPVSPNSARVTPVARPRPRPPPGLPSATSRSRRR